jgi:SAM-dependent methyltransferase
MEYSLSDELAACPGCGNTVRHLDYIPARRRKPDGKLVIFISGCDGCGMIFVNPPPSSGEVAAYYAEDGQWMKLNPEWAQELPVPQPTNVARIPDHKAGQNVAATVVVNARRVFGPNAGVKFLDFGCGRGQLMDQLAPYGFDCSGLDPATRAVVTRYPMLDALPTPPTFDAIAAIHVLEHTSNPLAVLENLRNALKRPGLLVFGSPTIDDLWQHRKKRYVMNEIRHLNGFTRHSLSALLSKAGFRALEFYAGTKPARFRCAAVTDDNPPQVANPLAAAEEAFRRFRETEPGWNPALGVRQNAWVYNEALMKEEKEARQWPARLRSVTRRAIAALRAARPVS